MTAGPQRPTDHDSSWEELLSIKCALSVSACTVPSCVRLDTYKYWCWYAALINYKQCFSVERHLGLGSPLGH